MPKKNFGKIIFCLIVSLVVSAYIYLTLNAPTPTNTRPEFTLSGIQRILVQLSFVSLMAITWILGAMAVWQGWSFSKASKQKEYNYIFKNLSLGIGVLLITIIASTFIGQIRTYNPGNQGISRTVTILVNYVYVAGQLLGFWFLYRGFVLVDKIKKVGVYNHNTSVGVILTVVIGFFWATLIFSNPTRQVSTGPGIMPSFYISDLLIITTIILPTLAGWFFGITSSLRLADFSIQASDENYQKALSRLVVGIWLLVLGFIILLGILSMGADRLIGLGLVNVLIIIYVFILVLLVAYWRVVVGIKSLYTAEQSTIPAA